ncbi:putative transposase [Pantoea stewartii subsp. stewartii DC283]|nr:putative transposase [Pantoea stewartii subsp. stewartii DC283]
MLMLHRGDTVSHVARTLCCARSSIGRWINWFTLSGAEGLKSLPSGRGRRWPFEHICALLVSVTFKPSVQRAPVPGK